MEVKKQTPAVVRAAFGRTDGTIAEARSASPKDINLSSVYSALIADAGRFAERFASDVLFDIKAIDEACEAAAGGALVDEIYCAAIRQNGVDGNAFLLCRLEDTRHGPLGDYYAPEHAYRRVLAARVHYDGEELVVTLKSVMPGLYRRMPDDLGEDGSLLVPGAEGYIGH